MIIVSRREAPELYVLILVENSLVHRLGLFGGKLRFHCFKFSVSIIDDVYAFTNHTVIITG